MIDAIYKVLSEGFALRGLTSLSNSYLAPFILSKPYLRASRPRSPSSMSTYFTKKASYKLIDWPLTVQEY